MSHSPRDESGLTKRPAWKRWGGWAVVFALLVLVISFLAKRRALPPPPRPVPRPTSSAAVTPAPSEPSLPPRGTEVFPEPSASGEALPSGLSPSMAGDSVCDRVFPRPPAVCAPEKDAASRLVRAGHWLGIAATPCTTAGEAGPRWRNDVESSLAALEIEAPETLPLGERVLTQSAALRIAFCADGTFSRTSDGGASSRMKTAAMSVAHRLAAAVADLDTLALPSAPLVPPSRALADASERTVDRPPLLHERGAAFTDWVRILVNRSYAGSVGYAVALAKDGTLHATHLVDHVEVRALSAGIPHVCVAHADLGYARCGVPFGLRPIAAPGQRPLAGTTETAHGPPCGGCHLRSTNLLSKGAPPSDLPGSLDARFRELVTELGPRLPEGAGR